jgi:hypothetical protein
MWRKRAKENPGNELKVTTRPWAPTPTLSVITAKEKATKRVIAGLKEVVKRVKVHVRERERKPKQRL